MHTIMRRIQSGKRWWAAEAAFRVGGLALLGLCAAAAIWLHHSLNQPPLHQAGVGELLVASIVAGGWFTGWPLLIQGPRLFELVTVPGKRGGFQIVTKDHPDERPDLVGRAGGACPADLRLSAPLRKSMRRAA